MSGNFLDSNVFLYVFDRQDATPLIVAAALEAGCTRLLSEDLQHGQRVETLTVENPFL